MRSKWCISGTHLWGSNGNLHSLVPLVFFFLMASLSVPLCIPGYVPHDYILDSIAHAVHISSHLAYVAVCCQKPSKYPTHFRKLIGPQLVVEVLGLSKMSPTIKIFFFCWLSFSELLFLLFDTMTGCWLMVIFRGHVRHFQNCMVKTLSRHPHCFGSFSLLISFLCCGNACFNSTLGYYTFTTFMWA